jgi:hypothetical protein
MMAALMVRWILLTRVIFVSVVVVDAMQ